MPYSDWLAPIKEFSLKRKFLHITPKPDMLKISFFPQIFQSFCLRKRINCTSTFYESLKVILP